MHKHGPVIVQGADSEVFPANMRHLQFQWFTEKNQTS